MIAFNTKIVDKVTILEVIGSVTLGFSFSRFTYRLEELESEGHLAIILNLSAADFIDSHTLGQIVYKHGVFAKKGGHLKICNPNRRVSEMFRITKMNTLIEIFTTEEEALESFEPAVTPG